MRRDAVGPMLALATIALLDLHQLPGVMACSCGPSHPQQTYCQTDLVIKAKVISSEVIGGEGEEMIRYRIQPKKVFKGSEKMESVEYVYTPVHEFLCGLLIQPKHQNYLLSGSVDTDGKVHVNMCGFNKPWQRVTPEQRAGLNGKYGDGCQCTVVPCLSIPCTLTSDTQCLWTDGILDGDWIGGAQSRRFSCSPRPPGPCGWLPLRTPSPTHPPANFGPVRH